ncbi:MAG: insulinase family protein [Desulfonatronovibrio sp. MSAO_Bac4]|nr:MAG: insulinase family protein [Desulfonatronovibrio sp. MSAO_Bac4]
MPSKSVILSLISLTLFTFTGPFNMAQAQEYHTLPNGLQVIIDKDPRFPLVSMRLYVRAGSAWEKPGEEGISHFLEHMFFKGTEKRGPGQVARDIEEVGGYLNAATSFDYTVYTIELPAREWKLGLDVFEDMIFGSTFEPQELNQEKNVVLAEIQRSLDNPGSRVFRSMQSMIFADTPYEHPILGFENTVKSFNREDLKNYINRLYQPKSMVLSVSGNLDQNEFLQETVRLFGSLENNDASYLPNPLNISLKQKDLSQRINVEEGPWRKTYMAMAVPAPELNSPLTPAFDILAYLLGGDRTSLLYKKFKYDLDMVDQISAQVLSLERTGMLYFYVQLDPDEIETFWGLFLKEIHNLNAEDFSSDQINRAVTNIEENLLRSRETLGGKASKLGFYQLFEKDPRAEEKYLHSLRRVTTHDLQDIIENHLIPANMAVTSVAPGEMNLSRNMLVNALEKYSLSEQHEEEQKRLTDAQTEIIDLGHGRTLVLIPDDHLPHTSINITWPGGNSITIPDEQGLAELSAKTLTRETKHRSFEQMQEFLRDRASSINASAGRESFNLTSRFPVKYSQDIMELVAEIINKPNFTSNELQRAVSEQISEIRQQEDRPLGYAFRHLFPFLFSSGSYGYLQLGEEDFLRQVEPDAVKSFWEKQRSMPFVISVCGQIDRKSLDQFVDSLTEQEPAEVAHEAGFAWSQEKTKDVILKDRSQAHILMIFPIPGKLDQDTPGLKVMNKILAGQGGILFRELRDRQGLAYSVTSLLWQTPKTGFLALYIGTYEDKVDEAIQGFEKVVEDLKAQALNPEDVQRASNLIYGGYHRGRQTISSRAGEASSLLVQGLDLDYNYEMTELTRDITPEQIQSMSRKYLIPENSYLMRILPQ